MNKSLFLSITITLGCLNLYAQNEPSDEIIPEAPPAWEVNMNDMLEESIEVTIECYDNMDPDKALAKNATYVPSKDYFAIFTIKNVAKALDLKWLEIRFTKKNLPETDFIKYYRTSKYYLETERHKRVFGRFDHGEEVEAILYFKVERELKEFELTRYGLYGELIPMGRRWNSLKTDDVSPKDEEF